MKRRLLWGAGVGVVCLFLYFTASVTYVRWALTQRASCTLPCAELSPASREGIPRCQPIQLELELARPRAQMGTRYALWYRAKLTNASCYLLRDMGALTLIYSWEGRSASPGLGRNGDFRLRVWDPSGKEVERVNFSPEFPLTHLYETDYAAYRELEPKLKKGGVLDLRPGESISSLPSRLHPTVERRMMDPQTGEHGYYFLDRPVPREAQTPPPGFAIVDMFKFTEPGVYEIQALFESHVSADPIHPFADSIPGFLRWPVRALKNMGWDFYPKDPIERGGRYSVYSESPKVRFEVVR